MRFKQLLINRFKMADDVEQLFKRAAERMRANKSLSLNNEEKLSLYGYYKQVTSSINGEK